MGEGHGWPQYRNLRQKFLYLDWAYPGRQKALDFSGAFCFFNMSDLRCVHLTFTGHENAPV